MDDDVRRACRRSSGARPRTRPRRGRPAEARERRGWRPRPPPSPPRPPPRGGSWAAARRRPSPRRARSAAGRPRATAPPRVPPGTRRGAARRRPRLAISSCSLVSSLPSTTHSSPNTPTTMHASATLNAGQATGSMKSITAPSRTRSARLPSAPPSRRPTGSHSHGIVAVHREVRHQQRQRDPDQDPDRQPRPLERPEGHARVARVREVQPEEDVHLLAALDVRVRELLRRLVHRHDQPSRGDRRGRAADPHGWSMMPTTIELTSISTMVATIGLRSSPAPPMRTGGSTRRKRLRYGSVTSVTNFRNADR